MREQIDKRFLLLALAWMLIIFWFSSQPSLFAISTGILDAIFKKTAHAAAYGILWFLWWRASGRRPWLALFVTVAYAISDEWHQSFVPGRHGRLFDVGVDTLGAAIALTRQILRKGS